MLLDSYIAWLGEGERRGGVRRESGGKMWNGGFLMR